MRGFIQYFKEKVKFSFMFSKAKEFAVQSGVAFAGSVVEESFNKGFS